MFDLTGRQALVTGSSRGIGRAIALGLARQGAEVCVHSAQPGSEAAAAVRDEIGALGRIPACISGDLTSEGTARAIVASAANALGGPIDILVVNAAIQLPQDLADIDAASARRQFDANVLSTINLIQSVAPRMGAAGWGRIVIIGSVQQWKPHPRMLVYAALKGALDHMARNLAVQLAPSGITVNTVAPGAVRTDRNAEALSDPAYRKTVESRIPMGRIGVADDCAGVVMMLCSSAGDYITGANIPVDGGMRLA